VGFPESRTGETPLFRRPDDAAGRRDVGHLSFLRRKILGLCTHLAVPANHPRGHGHSVGPRVSGPAQGGQQIFRYGFGSQTAHGKGEREPGPARGIAMNEESIFLEALGMDDLHERAQFLDRACAGDTVQRERIEKLLATHPEAGNFLEQPVSPLGGTIDEAPATVRQAGLYREQPGFVLAGQDKLLEQSGEGGMGTVWMAQQTRPVTRLVAVKLIKAGMDSKQVIARFEAERQALALMDHPHIAKVLDAGTTSAGRPYFVMEL